MTWTGRARRRRRSAATLTWSIALPLPGRGTPQTLRMCTRRSFSATSAATPSSPRRSTGRPGCCGSLSTAPKSFMRRPGGGGRSPSVRRWRPLPGGRGALGGAAPPAGQVPHGAPPLLLRGHDHGGDRPAAGPEPGHGAVPADAGQRQAAGAAGGGIAWIEENTSR